MLGALTNNADWAMAADVIVIWILAISLFICKIKEWKEEIDGENSNTTQGEKRA